MVNSGQIQLISDSFRPSPHLLPHEYHLMEYKRIKWENQAEASRSRIIEENLDILLLQETKCFGSEMDRILTQCWKQANTIHTDSRGTTGGLAILWNPTILILEVFLTTRWTISTDYREIGSDKEGIITNVYRPPIQSDKKSFLQILKGLRNIARGC
jgi:exonuclease III